MDNLKAAFDGIHAENELKENTLLYLKSEMRKRDTKHQPNPVRRFAGALASIVAMILLGTFSYNLYFTPSAYVDVEVNPSIELTLNRFDRVIGLDAYNDEGARILSELSLKHRNYDEALITLIDAINKDGYIQSSGLVSVTLQTDNSDKEAELLANIHANVTGYIAEHHHETQVDVFSVSSDIQSNARDLEVSPAKYIAIQELMVVDPTTTVESCRGHTINEIKRLTREHMGNHHGGGNADNGPISNDSGNYGDENCVTDDDSSQCNDQQEENRVNGRHHGESHQ